jgi:hypothetical protein
MDLYFIYANPFNLCYLCILIQTLHLNLNQYGQNETSIN